MLIKCFDFRHAINLIRCISSISIQAFPTALDLFDYFPLNLSKNLPKYKPQLKFLRK